MSLAASPASRRSRAQAAYERAVRMRATLSSRPVNTRLKADYENVVKTFRLVHWCDPAYGKAPVALAAAGELYAEMGHRFASEFYYQASIKAYQYVIAQYPHSSMARDALFTIGEIYRSDLEKPEEARATFQEFIKNYARSAKASEALEKLKQIDQTLAERAAGRTAKPGGQQAASLPEVTGIRRWVGPNYTRIVISVEGEVKFDTSRLPSPDRIVLDLNGTRLSSTLVGKTFPVENAFLQQIRVGQFQPSVTRVVLDVAKIEDYSVFTLPNPFRLVVDINGPAPKAAAKAPATSAKAAETAPAKGTEQASTKVEETAAKTETGQATSTRQGATKETASVKRPPLPASAAGKESAVPIKPAAPTEAGSRTLTRALGLKISRIVIDPGHGGHDTGTIGPTGLCEKDLVLDVGLRLKKLLESKAGAEVIMTRTDDTFIPLEERTAIANEKGADLFISIHANASRSRSARGIETYYLSFTTNPEALEVAARENATSEESVHQLQELIKKIALTEKIEESQEFAAQVQRSVYSRLIKAGGHQRNRGVKKAPFVVLIGANMPSVLAEISFLTNPRDERLLKRGDYREKIADALYRGVVQYVDTLGGVKVSQQARLDKSSTEAAEQKTSPSGTPNF
jgi:N-acetylmuramoyl-L-alanine amidase